jgi:trehalose-phosphatase
LQAERTRVVVITGRPETQAALLMPGLKIEIVGEHGWERMTPSGKIKRHPLDQDHKGSLDQARDLAKKRGMTLRIERKRSSIALHTRGMPPGQANLLECVVLAEWRRLCEDGRLACLRFNGGVELRSAAHTKGTAVRAIVQGQRKPDFVLYVGDDRTDEDAFEELKGVGHRMAVGPRVPEKMIEYRFTGPDQLGEFLAKWAKLEASLKKSTKKSGRS